MGVYVSRVLNVLSRIATRNLPSVCSHHITNMKRAKFAWKSTFDPIVYAAHFSVPAGYFEAAQSSAFYVVLVVLAG